MAILEVAQLEKSFGGTKVLRDISFSLEEGQALSIIGSSGSGKTTLLRCLNFLETPDSGRIAVRGRNLLDGSLSPQERRRNRLHFGLVFQDFNLFPQYTALENVTLARRLLAKSERTGEAPEAIRREGEALLEQKFDYIFFTGSVAVGRLVMEKAARWLTPVTLELGGKSPCIIDQTADLPLAAKRLAFGKYLNAGQTCVAPDYVLVHRDVHDGLLALLAGEIAAFYGSDPLACPDYGRIVNEKHFHRLMGLMDSGRVVCGGTGSAETLQIAPTVLADVSPDSPVMSEEIFGPVLPVLAYESLDEAVAFVNARPKPLALYLFTTDKAAERRVLRDCSFGGGCINDTIIHLATSDMGFGGVGESGMGSYHGKLSFDTFTHYKSIVKKSNRLDLPVRYQPYTKEKERMLRRVLK